MQDAYLLDTNVASKAFDGGSPENPRVRQKLADLGDSSLSICAVTVGEIFYGLSVSPEADMKRHEMIKKAVFSYFVWDINAQTAEVYARLRGKLFELHSPRDKRGRLKKKDIEDLTDATSAKTLGIQENDLWIMSVAVLYNLRFITMDANMRLIFEVAKQVYDYDKVELWELN